MDTSHETARRLREAREAAGFRIAGVADLISHNLGVNVSPETVRRLEVGDKDPLSDPQLVVALFDLYDRDTATEAPEVAERWGDWVKRYKRHAPRPLKAAATRGKHRPSARQIVGADDRELVGVS